MRLDVVGLRDRKNQLPFRCQGQFVQFMGLQEELMRIKDKRKKKKKL